MLGSGRTRAEVLIPWVLLVGLVSRARPWALLKGGQGVGEKPGGRWFTFMQDKS